MARPYKPLSQQKSRRTTEVQEELKIVEEKMSNLTSLEAEPPSWLSDSAKIEYNRIYPLLQELPVVSLDLGLVTAYCQAFGDYMDATELLNSEDLVIQTAHGSKLNPLHTVKKDSFSTINSIAPKLGMSIDSRMKIFSEEKAKSKEVDIMDEFL